MSGNGDMESAGVVNGDLVITHNVHCTTHNQILGFSYVNCTWAFKSLKGI